MACNVFGTPVTVETLEHGAENSTKATRKQLADVALSMKNADGKDANARSYLENLYLKMYNKSIYCALVLIYNATGDRIRLHESKYLYCIIAPAAPPPFIENGQWGAFLAVTVNREKCAGCSGAVVYRGHGSEGSELDLFMGWDTRVLPIKPNVCVEFDVPGGYDHKDRDLLLKRVQSFGPYTIAEKKGLLSTATIGMDHMSVVEFIHTLN